MRRAILASFAVLAYATVAQAAEADALKIDAGIQVRHLPFGTILDPIYASAASDQITGYTRCGDSALWTGAYLAAEAFRYNVTRSTEALSNVNIAVAGLKGLAEVTGDGRLARCRVPSNSPYAAGIAAEEAHNTVHQNGQWTWIDNTSRDQVIGVFFGLGIAYDLVDDPAVKSAVNDLTTRLMAFIAAHRWSPNDDASNTFLLRPEELYMLLQVAHHVNPANSDSGPLLVAPLNVGAIADIQGNSSYFKFNLDYMSFYHLIRLRDDAKNRAAYQIVRGYTAAHQNAFFDIVDRALNGPNAVRDAEAVSLLEQLLQRPARDNFVDNSSTVKLCGSEACDPVPVPLRPPADFLWQRDPFQLSGGGTGLIESAGVDYILPYWMARYFGVIAANAVQSAAAPSSAVAPNSLASLYGASLTTVTSQATEQPLPTSLQGVTLSVMDAAGVERPAPLAYVSPTQINFVVPDGTAPGSATILVTGGAPTKMANASIAGVAPTLFSMNGAGTGIAAATAIRTQLPNQQLQSPVQVFSCVPSGCISVPIDPGIDTPVYLTFYGTGIRNRSSLANVSVTIAGIPVPVLYAGPAPKFTGLDQVNVALLLALRGAGESGVVVTVDGHASNTVTVNIR